MIESLRNRAAAIRDYLDKRDLSIDPTMLYRYSVTAAQWEAVRLFIDRGNVTPADDRRFADLTNVLRALSEQIGLGGELTDSRGFLIGDPSRIICDTWQEAAEGW
jgi:hypothetical protein